MIPHNHVIVKPTTHALIERAQPIAERPIEFIPTLHSPVGRTCVVGIRSIGLTCCRDINKKLIVSIRKVPNRGDTRGCGGTRQTQVA